MTNRQDAKNPKRKKNRNREDAKNAKKKKLNHEEHKAHEEEARRRYRSRKPLSALSALSAVQLHLLVVDRTRVLLLCVSASLRFLPSHARCWLRRETTEQPQRAQSALRIALQLRVLGVFAVHSLFCAFFLFFPPCLRALRVLRGSNLTRVAQRGA
jgi:hypothetical protein